MLILSRRCGEKIKIGDDIEIILLNINGQQGSIGIKAPLDLPVHRQEIYDKINKKKPERREDDELLY